MKAPRKDESIPVISLPEELAETDGILFGSDEGLLRLHGRDVEGAGALWEACGVLRQHRDPGRRPGDNRLVHHGMLFVPIGYTFGVGMFKMDEIRGASQYGAGVFAGDGTREPTETELALAEHQGTKA